MIKNSVVQDPQANAKKDETDRRAGELLKVDPELIKQDAEVIYNAIKRRLDGSASLDLVRLVVAGGAGAGKTSISKPLSELLGTKHLDMDKYVPGGYTSDKNEYARRVNKALYEMWEDLPSKTKQGWVVEHVEAASPEVVGLLNPTFALLLDPSLEKLREVAMARGAAENDGEWRCARALQSAQRALKQFEALEGVEVEVMKGMRLKDLRP